MEQLKACYEKYIAEAEDVWKKRSAWDGAFGIGSSSKNHPCHTIFFEELEKWAENFANSNPAPQEAEAAMTYILEAAEPYKKQVPYWALYAAHGMARPLVAFVSPQYAAKTRIWYNQLYPRKDRLPVHQDLFKLLKKRERA